MNRFVADFPHAFEDPRYLRQERDYKWEAHLRVEADLLSAQGRRIVAEGAPEALAKMLKALIGVTNLPAPRGAHRGERRAARGTSRPQGRSARRYCRSWRSLTRHMFLKPMQTQRIAEAFHVRSVVLGPSEVGHLRPAVDPEQSATGATPPSRGPRSDRRAIVHVGCCRVALHEAEAEAEAAVVVGIRQVRRLRP